MDSLLMLDKDGMAIFAREEDCAFTVGARTALPDALEAMAEISLQRDALHDAGSLLTIALRYGAGDVPAALAALERVLDPEAGAGPTLTEWPAPGDLDAATERETEALRRRVRDFRLRDERGDLGAEDTDALITGAWRFAVRPLVLRIAHLETELAKLAAVKSAEIRPIVERFAAAFGADVPRAPGVVSPVDRETLGRVVRAVWVAWAREQPAPKASWLAPWEELSEPDREVDRRIGERLWTMGAHASSLAEVVEASAREPHEDVVLHALHVSGGAAAVRAVGAGLTADPPGPGAATLKIITDGTTEGTRVLVLDPERDEQLELAPVLAVRRAGDRVVVELRAAGVVLKGPQVFDVDAERDALFTITASDPRERVAEERDYWRARAHKMQGERHLLRAVAEAAIGRQPEKVDDLVRDFEAKAAEWKAGAAELLVEREARRAADALLETSRRGEEAARMQLSRVAAAVDALRLAIANDDIILGAEGDGWR